MEGLAHRGGSYGLGALHSNCHRGISCEVVERHLLFQIMRVLIVGLDHKFQSVELLNLDNQLTEIEREMKNKFREWLVGVVRNRDVKFVGEEAKHGLGETIAHGVARSFGILYSNIDMTGHDRQMRGIPSGYAESTLYSPAEKNKWNIERVEFMFERAIKQADCAEDVLILCGRAHKEALSQCFETAGNQVDTYDMRCEDWYVEDWLSFI